MKVLRFGAWSAMLLLPALLFVGCSKKGTGGKTLAKVGNEVLTEETVKKDLASNRGGGLQEADYVNRWVEAQALFEEAKKRKLDTSEEIERAVVDLRKRMAINALIQKEIIDKTQGSVSDSAMRAYYNLHAGEFALQEDAAKLNFAIFKDRGLALAFRNNVAKSGDWKGVYERFAQDSSNSARIVAHVEGQQFKKSTFFPAELWKDVTNMSRGEVSVPRPTQFGIYVIQLEEFLRAGQPAGFDLVKKDLEERILFEKRQDMFNKFLESVKKQYHAETFLSASDSSKKPKE